MQSPIELEPMHQIGTQTLPRATGGAGIQIPSQHRQGDICTREGVQSLSLGDIIAEICGEFTAVSSGRKDVIGFIKCPGEHRHNHQTSPRDTAVVVPPNSLPVIKCFHDSCQKEVSALSEELRMAIEDAVLARKLDFSWEKPSEEAMLVWNAGKDAENGAKNKKSQVIANGWDPESIERESPVQVPASGEEQGRMLLSLFPDEEIVWMGNTWNSGQPRHRTYFKTAREWREIGLRGWHSYTTGASYNPGVYSRGNESVFRRRFLIAESDSLTKPEMGAVLRFVSSIGFNLRAVVDSGKRSIHGWFDLDGLDLECIAVLEGMLRGFGMDSKTMRASQPVRMAGVLRTLDDGRAVPQSLLYLNPA